MPVCFDKIGNINNGKRRFIKSKYLSGTCNETKMSAEAELELMIPKKSQTVVFAENRNKIKKKRKVKNSSAQKCKRTFSNIKITRKPGLCRSQVKVKTMADRLEV